MEIKSESRILRQQSSRKIVYEDFSIDADPTIAIETDTMRPFSHICVQFQYEGFDQNQSTVELQISLDGVNWESLPGSNFRIPKLTTSVHMYNCAGPHAVCELYRVLITRNTSTVGTIKELTFFGKA